MKKDNLAVFIFDLLCGLTCAGLGIYYICIEEGLKAVVFLVVGAVCLVIAVRALIRLLKEKKDKDKKDK